MIYPASITIAVQLIKQHEGLRLKPYQCSAGKTTIGYGRNLDDVGISLDEARQMLNQDINNTIDWLAQHSWFDQCDPARQAALIDMVFNLGVTRFLGFKKMIAALKQKDYGEASKQMLASRWANQVGNRAVTLAWMMQTGRINDEA